MKRLEKTWITSAHQGFVEENIHSNTLVAYKLAASKGTDMIETDARMIKDGILIVNHDAEVKGYDESGNEVKLVISETNYSVIKNIRLLKENAKELSEAVTIFSEKYPTVDVQITVGSHEELYRAMENDSIDLALNDQRRAFSDAYNNKILAESKIYIEMSAKNPLSKLSSPEASDPKNTPCILLINQAGQKEEQEYYESIIGLHGEFIFADTMQEARL